jgi:hypothetical protein
MIPYNHKQVVSVAKPFTEQHTRMKPTSVRFSHLATGEASYGNNHGELTPSTSGNGFLLSEVTDAGLSLLFITVHSYLCP